jgi:hypothetical protein
MCWSKRAPVRCTSRAHLVLNDDPVRCIADIDLGTLKGTGRLAIEEKPRRWLSDGTLALTAGRLPRRVERDASRGGIGNRRGTRHLWGHTDHSARVGDRRAARMAGSSPAKAPMTTAAPRPPTQASVGMTMASWWA